MPKQGLEVLPIAGYDVSICFKSGRVVKLPHARIQRADSVIHVGLIGQNSHGSYPFIKSTTEYKTEEIWKIAFRPSPEEPLLVLYA